MPPRLVTFKAQLTEEAAAAWQRFCDQEGVTFGAMCQAYGERLNEAPEDEEYTRRQSGIVARAREIAAERRKRR